MSEATAVASDTLVSLADVRAAAARVEGLIVRTPLLESHDLSEQLGHEVRLKCENLQRSGSFKARGALNFVYQLPPDQVKRGVITYSSGNHGQAMALAAMLKGVRAVIVMPTTAPPVKVEGAKRLGAEVVFEGTMSGERKVRAEAIAKAEGLVMVPPFDHPWIIAGQGTMGLEIHEDWPEVETVLAPIGGGGMVSGVCASLRRLHPGVRLIGVEPTGAPSMRAALDAKQVVTLPGTKTIADGLMPVRVGDLTYKHVSELADDVVTVDDDMIREAARFLLLRRKLVVEYSGAATVAALLSGAVGSPGRTVAILSGGNMDPGVVAELATQS
jgi:threonine dehydratase